MRDQGKEGGKTQQIFLYCSNIFIIKCTTCLKIISRAYDTKNETQVTVVIQYDSIFHRCLKELKYNTERMLIDCNELFECPLSCIVTKDSTKSAPEQLLILRNCLNQKCISLDSRRAQKIFVVIIYPSHL